MRHGQRPAIIAPRPVVLLNPGRLSMLDFH